MRSEITQNSAHREPSHNFFRHRVCPRGDLLRRLILNGMLDVNRVKARASQSTGLHSCRSRELSGGHGHRWNAQIFQSDRVVQTARCARPSIRQPFHHRIHPAQLLDDLWWRVLGKRRLFGAQHFRCAILAP